MKETTMIANSQRPYVPAAGRDWALPLYDPIVKLLGGDSARKTLLDQAALQPSHRVLDVGCGTGTLATLIKRLHPAVDVVGLDPDPKALARAKRKAARASISIQLDKGFGDNLPYPEASFDRVLSSFMFHHLPTEEKEKMLREVRRVLTSAGEFHMLDFERPDDAPHGLLTHFRRSRDRLKDNSERRILSLSRQAGFANVKNVGQRAILFGVGCVGYYSASNSTVSAGLG
jgi:ubiquinone/menaquinone biosynthesis C-methylase UbiE